MGLVFTEYSPLEGVHPFSTADSAYNWNYRVGLNGSKAYNAIAIHLDSRMWQHGYKKTLGAHDVDFMQVSKDGVWWEDVLPRLFDSARALWDPDYYPVGGYFIWQRVYIVGQGSRLHIREQVVKPGEAPTKWALATCARFIPMFAEYDSEAMWPMQALVGVMQDPSENLRVNIYSSSGETLRSNGNDMLKVENKPV